MMKPIIIIWSLFLLDICYGVSTPESSFYGAAVVEFHPNPQIKNFTERTNSNLAVYLKIITEQPDTVDIIVFPESTLNNLATPVFVPEIDDNNVIPCDNTNYTDADILYQLSCAAKNARKYLVINLSEKAECPDKQMKANNDDRTCPASNLSFYNANVVFDRTGKVISHYRKFNLFENVNKPKYPEAVTFKTDFGVTFGHFICFDLMFQEPALKLVRELNVSDIIFPTMWFSELPFLTAVQIQQAWAYKNNVNLLAAGANYPQIGSTGTGIYAGRLGSIVSTMAFNNLSSVFTAQVPKRNSKSEINPQFLPNPPQSMQNLYLKRDQIDSYKTVPIETGNFEGNFTQRTCNGTFCCDFQIEYEGGPDEQTVGYHFRTAVFHGNRTFDGFADGNVILCSIIACTNSTLESCGLRISSTAATTRFKKIEISGMFPYDDDYFIMPNSVDTLIMPLKVTEFTYVEEPTVKQNGKPHRRITMSLTQPKSNLLSFGIYGRDFTILNF